MVQLTAKKRVLILELLVSLLECGKEMLAFSVILS